jgi:hypothetical protein
MLMLYHTSWYFGGEQHQDGDSEGKHRCANIQPAWSDWTLSRCMTIAALRTNEGETTSGKTRTCSCELCCPDEFNLMCVAVKFWKVLPVLRVGGQKIEIELFDPWRCPWIGYRIVSNIAAHARAGYKKGWTVWYMVTTLSRKSFFSEWKWPTRRVGHVKMLVRWGIAWYPEEPNVLTCNSLALRPAWKPRDIRNWNLELFRTCCKKKKSPLQVT